MQIKARLENFRMSPRKVRLVVNLIKNLDVIEAKAQLIFLNKKAANPILKLLNSAIANAKHNFNLPEEVLYVKNILVDEGPSLKRWLPRARGIATPILKRTTHVTLILETREGLKKSIKYSTKKEIKEEAKDEIETKSMPEKVETLEKLSQIQKEKRPRMPEKKSRMLPSKKRFFSRQTFGNIKKIFRRKSM